MRCNRRLWMARLPVGLCVALLLCTGCETLECCCAVRPPVDMPHELCTKSLEPYVIEPPDVLLIDAIRLIPKPPYKVQPLDVLGIQVKGTPETSPIAGLYTVAPEGTVTLGYSYGTVQVEGLTLSEVKTVLEKHLTMKIPSTLKMAEATVEMVESRALQQIRGPHLVRPDGTVGLGVYGGVYVDGLTIPDAKAAIENYLSEFFLKPEISLDVSGFNSKVYYVVTDGGGFGEQVARFPVTGKATVLDALSQVNGLAAVSSKHYIYLVRPTTGKKAHAPVEEVNPAEFRPYCCSALEDPQKGKIDQEVYHVNWNAIVRCGDARTNYQVLPGDRIYIMASPIVTTDTWLARIISPMERIFGIVGLGNVTVREFLTPIPTNTTGIIAQ